LTTATTTTTTFAVVVAVLGLNRAYSISTPINYGSGHALWRRRRPAIWPFIIV